MRILMGTAGEYVYLSPPHMGDAERAYLLAAFDSNWIAPAGPDIVAFESAFSELIDVANAVAVSSGTAALHLALEVLGVRKGDDVLVSDLTFAATANAVVYAGAQPVFIDADTTSWNMDPELLAAELHERAAHGQLPAAVIVVDLYGQCADYDRIVPLCHSFGIPVIEDAAEALGATYKGRPAGSLADLAAFSFNGNKIITTSGGGMLVGARADLIERARYLATQAREPVPHYEHVDIGYNYRLSNLLAAMGRGQLEHLCERVDARRRINKTYRSAFDGIDGIDFLPVAVFGEPTHWLTVITIDPLRTGTTNDAVRLALAEQQIEARPAWKPMHLQPVFAKAPHRGGAVGERVFATGLCLPSGSSLAEHDQERVIETVTLALRR